MKIKVHMLAFMTGEIREVTIPESSLMKVSDPPSTDELLDLTFYWGQNDFQAVGNFCSVSSGDVIELDNHYWLVKMAGFRDMTPDEFTAYKNLKPDDRLRQTFQ